MTLHLALGPLDAIRQIYDLVHIIFIQEMHQCFTKNVRGVALNTYKGV